MLFRAIRNARVVVEKANVGYHARFTGKIGPRTYPSGLCLDTEGIDMGICFRRLMFLANQIDQALTNRNPLGRDQHLAAAELIDKWNTNKPEGEEYLLVYDTGAREEDGPNLIVSIEGFQTDEEI